MATKKRKAARKSAKTSRKKTRNSPAKSRTAAKSRARKTAPKRRRSSRKTAVRRGSTRVAPQSNPLRDRETPPPGAVEQMLDAAADTSRKAASKVKEFLNL